MDGQSEFCLLTIVDGLRLWPFHPPFPPKAGKSLWVISPLQNLCNKTTLHLTQLVMDNDRMRGLSLSLSLQYMCPFATKIWVNQVDAMIGKIPCLWFDGIPASLSLHATQFWSRLDFLESIILHRFGLSSIDNYYTSFHFHFGDSTAIHLSPPLSLSCDTGKGPTGAIDL